MENIEQKQLIKPGTREDNKIRPLLIKLGNEETGTEILLIAKRL